jgi:hypothetical protein
MLEKEKATKALLDEEGKAAKLNHEPIFTDTSPEVIARAILENLYHVQGRVPQLATPNDWYMALAHTVRDRMLDGWVKLMRVLTKDVRVPDGASPGEQLDQPGSL